MKEEELIQECKKIIECDTARISKTQDKMFLIIGFNRNTKDVFCQDGSVINDYTGESVVASGYTEEELIESLKTYVKARSMPWEEYLTGIGR